MHKAVKTLPNKVQKHCDNGISTDALSSSLRAVMDEDREVLAKVQKSYPQRKLSRKNLIDGHLFFSLESLFRPLSVGIDYQSGSVSTAKGESEARS